MHITTKFKFLSIAVMAAAIFGCSSGNGSTPLVDSTGKHPAGWFHNHSTMARSSYAQCTGCHGTDAAGGITAGCGSCHVLADNPLTPARQSNCSTCHGGPQEGGPYGAVTDLDAKKTFVSPNRAYSHGPHTTLPQVIGNGTSVSGCANACHNSYGPSSANKAAHANGTVNVAFSTTYDEATGKTASYSTGAGTCSNVSCHGGKVTPEWKTQKFGTTAYSMSTACSNCHELWTSSTTSYNYYVSGKHAFHLDPAQVQAAVAVAQTAQPGYDYPLAITCTDCHSISVLTDQTKHFSGIAAPARSTVTANANVTVGSTFFTYSTGTSMGNKCGNITCHPNALKLKASW